MVMPVSPSHALMPITPRPSFIPVRGEGSYLFAADGAKCLDFIQGWAVNALGHAAPEVTAAIARQAGQLLTASPALFNYPALELAERLVALTGLNHITFCSSGAEANEAALKLCRKWGARHRAGAFEVLSTDNSFHGRTLATMALSGKSGWDVMFPPQPPGFRKVPFDDVEAMRRAITPSTVALCVEPIQGEAGVVVPKPGYLKALRALCDEAGLLFVLDEVQTGFGRTGSMFAFEAAGVVPDILTLGKGLGGGVPLSAVVTHSRAGYFNVGEQGGTFHGNPLACSAAMATLDVLTAPGFLEAAQESGQYLAAGLQRLALKHGGSWRGQGLLQALILPAPRAPEIVSECLLRGLLLNAARPHILRLMPSLRVTHEELEIGLNCLDSVLTEQLARARAS